MTETFANIPIRSFEDAVAWRAWLVKNNDDQVGVWIKIAKKNSGINSVTYAEALDEALCYGWIDGQKRRYDDAFFLQKFTPRRKRSLWSKVNIEKVTQLIQSGRMQAAGQLAIDAATADGRWDAAYDSQSTATVPPDLQAQLHTNAQAGAFFETLTKAERYSILHKLMTASSPETRAKRLVAIMQKLESGQK